MPKGKPSVIRLPVDELCYYSYQECTIANHDQCPCRPKEKDSDNPIEWRKKVEAIASWCEYKGSRLSVTGWEKRYKLLWPKGDPDAKKIPAEVRLMCAIFEEPLDTQSILGLFHHSVSGVSLHNALMSVLDSIKDSKAEQKRDSKAKQGEISYLSCYKEVVLRWFGFGADRRQTFQQIGTHFNFSKERARRIVIRTLKTLRHPGYKYVLTRYFRDGK